MSANAAQQTLQRAAGAHLHCTERTICQVNWVQVLRARFLELVLSFGRFPFTVLFLPSHTPQGHNTSHWATEVGDKAINRKAAGI